MDKEARSHVKSAIGVLAVVALVVTLEGCGGASKPSSDARNIQLANGVSMPLLAAGMWQYNDTQAEESVVAALKAGFKHIDNAHDYNNQVGVGKGLKSSGVKREDVFITSKVPGCGFDNLSADDCKGNTLKFIQEDIDQITKGGYDVKYLDLILLHFPPCTDAGDQGFKSTCFKEKRGCDKGDNCNAIADQWAGMEKAYKDGLVKAIGVSNYCSQCFDCLGSNHTVFPMVNQVQLHVGMGPDPQGFVSFAKSHNMVLTAWSPLGHGGKGTKEILSGNLTSGIGSAHNKSAPQVALKWLIQHGLSVATKSSNYDHLVQDLDMFDWDLSADDMKSLDAATFAKEDTPSFLCQSPQIPEATVV